MNDIGGGPGLNRGFTDELDARGTFSKAEAKRELGRLNRSELEGRLGLSQHKVEEILTRAEKKSKQKYRRLGPGDIHYKVFLGGLKVIKFSSAWIETLNVSPTPGAKFYPPIVSYIACLHGFLWICFNYSSSLQNAKINYVDFSCDDTSHKSLQIKAESVTQLCNKATSLPLLWPPSLQAESQVEKFNLIPPR